MSSPSQHNQVCPTRRELLDSLARTVEQLGRAKRHLTKTPELERLRNDYGLLRAELECHRASHGC